MDERESVRTRVREPEPQETQYDRAIRDREIRNQRQAEGKVVIKSGEIPWELNRQGRLKFLIMERTSQDLAAPGWIVFQQQIYNHSGMHRHQGGTFIFVLGGKGYSVVNGTRYDWAARDLAILPMVPGGVAHQHFNLDPAVPALWMRVGYHLHKDPVIANWIEQIEVNPEWAEKKGLQDRRVAPLVNRARVTNSDDSPRGDTLFDALLRLRDEQREQLKRSRMVIKGDSLSLEVTPMGLLRWYVHPFMRDVGCRAQLMYVQEIPPGSRSGKQLCQGGRFHYVLEGKGCTVIDGTRHDWEKDDIVLLPVKSHGVVHQHYNADPQRPAELLVSEPNWVDVWSVDLGSGFQMLEAAPEYRS